MITRIPLGSNDQLYFNVNSYVLSNGNHSLEVQATAELFDASNFSNTVTFNVEGSIFAIIFYNSSAEKGRVNKLSYLSNPLSLRGSLRESSSIISPSVSVLLTGIFQYNYCYIPYFKRYYFVDNITSIRTDMWQIDLSVDVLMSFLSEINNLEVITSRQEFNFNPLIEDENIPIECYANKQYIPIGDSTFFIPSNPSPENDVNMTISTCHIGS